MQDFRQVKEIYSKRMSGFKKMSLSLKCQMQAKRLLLDKKHSVIQFRFIRVMFFFSFFFFKSSLFKFICHFALTFFSVSLCTRIYLFFPVGVSGLAEVSGGSQSSLLLLLENNKLLENISDSCTDWLKPSADSLVFIFC